MISPVYIGVYINEHQVVNTVYHQISPVYIIMKITSRHTASFSQDMEQPDIESAPPVRVLTPLDCSDWKLREEKQRRLCGSAARKAFGTERLGG